MSKLRRLISFILAFSLLCPVVFVRVSAYNDTEGHWAAQAIARWTERGVVQGDGISFRPDAPITGGELASVIAKTLDFNVFSTDGDKFWYSPYLRKCASERITVNTEKPYISRQDAMVALSQALSVTDGDRSALSSYLDADQVADAAVPYVSGMIASGIVNGVRPDWLAPGKALTRAELITMLDRAIVQVISEPGRYELSDAPGIILIASADVTLTGKTNADILVTNGADGGTVTFQDAIVTGRFTVRANNALIVNNNSELPMIGFFGWGSDLKVLPLELPPVVPPAVKGSSKPEPVYKALNISKSSSSHVIDGGEYSYITIEKDLDDSDVTLKNVTIHDNLLIQGGGSNSIHLENCKISGEVRMEKSAGEPPRLHLTKTPVGKVIVRNPAIIEADDAASLVKNIEARSDLIVRGEQTSVDNIEVKAANETSVAVSLENGRIRQMHMLTPTTVSNRSAEIAALLAGSQLTLREGRFPSLRVTADDTASIFMEGGRPENIEIDGKAELHGNFDAVTVRGSMTLQEGRIQTLYTPPGAGNAVAVNAVEGARIDKAEINRLTAFDAQGAIESVHACADVTLLSGRLPEIELRSDDASVPLHLTVIDGAEIDKTLVYTSNKIIIHGEGSNHFFSPDKSITPQLEFSYMPAGLLPHIHIYREYTEISPVTCTNDGRWRAQCIGCDKYLERTIKVHGHIWGEPVIEAATTEKEGCKLFTCERCGETRKEIIPKLPKKEDDIPTSIRNIRFEILDNSLVLAWDTAGKIDSTKGTLYSAELQNENGAWQTVQYSSPAKQCSLLQVPTNDVRYVAARVKMFSGSKLLAAAEQDISFCINVSPSNDAAVTFRKNSNPIRATVQKAESDYIYRLDIMPPSYMTEHRVFTPDADGNAYFDLQCTSAVLGKSTYRLARFVPSVTENGAVLTVERTGWIECTNAYADNHSIGFRIDEINHLVLDTDVEDIQNCTLVLKGTPGTEDNRIELKDDLSLTERFLSTPVSLFYQSAFLSHAADGAEEVLAHSSESLTVKMQDALAIQNVDCTDEKIVLSVGVIDEKAHYYLLSDGNYLPLEILDGRLVGAFDTDFSGKKIDVIRTRALKVESSFILYISSCGDGFTIPAHETEEKGETENSPEETKPEEKGESGNPPEETKPEEKGEGGTSPEEPKPEEKEEPVTSPEKPEPSGEQGSAIDTAEKFIAAMQNGGTVKLTQGLTFDPNVYLYSIELSSEVVLDLNGQTLNFGLSSLEVAENAMLTILDSADGGTILSEAPAVHNNGGTVIIEGGTLKGIGENPALWQYDGQLTITSGSLIAESTALYVSNGTAVIENGYFSGKKALWASGTSTVTINNGEFIGEIKQGKKAIVIIGENVKQSA